MIAVSRYRDVTMVRVEVDGAGAWLFAPSGPEIEELACAVEAIESFVGDDRAGGWRAAFALVEAATFRPPPGADVGRYRIGGGSTHWER